MAHIDKILKNGMNTKIKYVDYNSSAKRKELIKLKKKSEAILKRKDVDIHRLSLFIINK